MDGIVWAMDDIYSWLRCFPMGWYDKNAFWSLAENVFLKAHQELSGRIWVIYGNNWRSMWYEECMLYSHHLSTTFFLSLYFFEDPVICLIYIEENFIQLFSYKWWFSCFTFVAKPFNFNFSLLNQNDKSEWSFQIVQHIEIHPNSSYIDEYTPQHFFNIQYLFKSTKLWELQAFYLTFQLSIPESFAAAIKKNINHQTESFSIKLNS